ncbi:hypothetical protein [Catellatospora paridis]|uniref:hypothetical protein n=1 Tax=Catellatospora paridis TaxID=1617086 RepID=UPI0012D38A30|nr:hypothetical protein [Catellatospora paridis]
MQTCRVGKYPVEWHIPVSQPTTAIVEATGTASAGGTSPSRTPITAESTTLVGASALVPALGLVKAANPTSVATAAWPHRPCAEHDPGVGGRRGSDQPRHRRPILR